MAIQRKATVHATLLIVDDHPPVRRIVARWAERAGLSTREAGSAESAVEVLQSVDIAGVLSDVDMPGRSGIWLAAWIARHRPHVEVGLMSGRTPDTRAAHDPFFEKPLDTERLLGWLETIGARDRTRDHPR